MMNYGKVLSDLMQERNIDSLKLATDLSVTRTCIYRWRQGIKDIGLSNLILLCKYFNCSLDYLVGLTENDSRHNNFDIENFGKQVRKIMKSKGISSYKLQQDTRYHGKYFIVWDKGADPKLSTLLELANYFVCSLDELVGIE